MRKLLAIALLTSALALPATAGIIQTGNDKTEPPPPPPSSATASDTGDAPESEDTEAQASLIWDAVLGIFVNVGSLI